MCQQISLVPNVFFCYRYGEKHTHYIQYQIGIDSISYEKTQPKRQSSRLRLSDPKCYLQGCSPVRMHQSHGCNHTQVDVMHLSINQISFLNYIMEELALYNCHVSSSLSQKCVISRTLVSHNCFLKTTIVQLRKKA